VASRSCIISYGYQAVVTYGVFLLCRIKVNKGRKDVTLRRSVILPRRTQ
jgi:hypothetical protein